MTAAASPFVVPPRPLRPRVRDVVIGLWLYFQVGSLAFLLFAWPTLTAAWHGRLQGTELQRALQEPLVWATFASVLFELFWVSRLVLVRGSGSFALDLGLRFRPADLGLGLAGWVAIFVGSVVLDRLVLPYLLPGATGPEPFNPLGPYAALPLLAKTVLLVTIGVLVPFGEEMLFRGVLLGLCSRWMGPVVGIVLSSIVFGALHAQAWTAHDVAYALWAAWAGVVFATLRVGTARLGPGIVAHGLQNSLVVALALASHH